LKSSANQKTGIEEGTAFLEMTSVFGGSDPLNGKKNRVSKRAWLSSDGHDLFWLLHTVVSSLRFLLRCAEEHCEKARKIIPVSQKATLPSQTETKSRTVFDPF
jgi:hypothetical protein